MWYFAWVLGIGFAVLLAILNALWGENEEARAAALEDALRGAPHQLPAGSLGAHDSSRSAPPSAPPRAHPRAHPHQRNLRTQGAVTTTIRVAAAWNRPLAPPRSDLRCAAHPPAAVAGGDRGDARHHRMAGCAGHA